MKPIDVEEDVVLVMVLLEKLRCLDCGIFFQAPNRKGRSNVRRNMDYGSGGHGFRVTGLLNS